MIRLLLALYPPGFRAQFGAEIEADLADLRQTGWLPFIHALAELAATGLRARAQASLPMLAGATVAFGLHACLYAILLQKRHAAHAAMHPAWFAPLAVMLLTITLWDQRRRVALLGLTALALLAADSPGRVLSDLEKRYERAFEGFHKARSLEDLDRIHRWLDTPDWRSVVGGQPARSWEDLRQYGFKGIWTSNRIPWRIVGFRLAGPANGGAEVEMRIGGVRVVDTWLLTPNGWRRSRHEKFP